jgi:hypothetical protein
MDQSEINESEMLLKMMSAVELEFDRYPKAFTYESDTEYLNPFEKPEPKTLGGDYRAYKKLTVRFFPRNDPNCSKTNIDQLCVQWTPITGEMFIYIEFVYSQANPRQNYGGNFILESGDKADLVLRKKMYSIFKKIKNFHEVEEPRKEKEQLVSAIYDAFPEMLDIELFGEQLDKES